MSENASAISANSTDRVAVIVVNYGTAALAIEAVESVLSHQHGTLEVDVHLVDNASPGEDAAIFRQISETPAWKNRVTLWLETDNHGFGRGNNVVLQALAAQASAPDKVFLLNPDACLHNEAIEILARALDDDPSAAVAGAGVLRPDLSPAVAAFRFPSFPSEVSRILALGAFDRLVADRKVALPNDQPGGPVDWVSGAAVMFRLAPMAQVGFFDPAFFLYYEEVDLMRRLSEQGWRVLYVPQAQVMHREGAATGQFASAHVRQRDPWYLYVSWRHYCVRSFGRFWSLAVGLALWPAGALNVLHRGLRGKPPTIPRRFFRDHWRFVLWPLIRRTGP